MNLPAFIPRYFHEARFPELVCFFRKMWDRQAWLYLKRNTKAVERIKQEFTKLTQQPPYKNGSNPLHWDQQIAKYLDRLGVKALILDMRDAVAKQPGIHSILYFVYSKSGACRWENLVMLKIENDWTEKKKQHAEDYDELAKLIDLKLPGVEPEWVPQARKRLQFLTQKRPPMHPRDRVEINREIDRIQNNLRKYNLKPTD